MTRKQVETHDRKRKKAMDIPSTGQGAASALDAMVKRRLGAAGAGTAPPPRAPKKH